MPLKTKMVNTYKLDFTDLFKFFFFYTNKLICEHLFRKEKFKIYLFPKSKEILSLQQNISQSIRTNFQSNVRLSMRSAKLHTSISNNKLYKITIFNINNQFLKLPKVYN